MDESSAIIPLREWIGRTWQTVDVAAKADSFVSSFGSDSSSWPADIRRPLAVSSDPYLALALRVARSLAEQICQMQERADGEQLLSLPTPGPDWADRVAVHVSPTHEGCQSAGPMHEGDMEPLPFSPEKPSSDPKELQDMLNSLITDESLYTKEDAAEDLPGSEEVRNVDGVEGVDMFSYHHTVTKAEVLPSPNSDGCLRKDEMSIIHCLGIVLYELFSGGERPSEITRQNGTKHTPLEGGGDIQPEPLQPLLHNEPVELIDLAGGLNILDDLADDVRGVGESVDGFKLGSDDEESMPRKKKGPQVGGTIQSIPLEPLELMGLPVSICNMIANMLDCINGDLSGAEAYQRMSDVRNDLQLMLEQPNRFLDDLDLDKLAVTGLPLNEAVFDRDEEFSTLKDSYRRSIRETNELGIIVGPSGIGKSVLANRLGSYITATGGLFLTGKFDQLQQAKPFSALASAFNEYCNKMCEEGRSRRLTEVASKLSTTLGKDAHHLVKVIPSLSLILGGDLGQQDEGQDCVDAQRRLQYLLCQFVDVISTASGAPIALFLDDLHWSDQASISAIYQVLMTAGSTNEQRQFFVLGSCREEGLLEGHPFAKLVSNIRHFGIHSTTVELGCMDKETTNRMVSDLLCLPPRLTRSLSESIHHKTKGNPLFSSQLLASLYKDGLVSLSLKSRRWVWDEAKIQSRKLPDNVAAFLSSAIAMLPKEVQDALCTLSCFGASCDRSIIVALETNLNTPITASLDKAVSEGMLDNIDDNTYSFAHDRLQEAAYSMIKPEERCLFHFKYGVILVPLALELQDDSLLFEAAGQINKGGPAAVEDAEQGLLIANINLTAGHKAMGMSDFTSAFTYVDNGISFLRKGHWKEHYDLSLALFESACKCALVLGDIVSLKLLSEQVIRFAKSFDDTLNSKYYVICALAYTSNLPESIDRSLVVLRELGEELPESLAENDLQLHIENTKVMLQGFTDEELIQYRMMTDSSKLMAMKFAARLENSCLMARPHLQPIVTLKMVQLSVALGMSPVSPVGFTHFGQLLAKFGDIREGCRYVNIARRLLDRLGAHEYEGQVLATGTQILSFVEPLQTALELHVHGQAAAMAAGDTDAALLNSIMYVGMRFAAGAKLSVLKEEYRASTRLMEEHGHMTWLAHITQMEKNVSQLMGHQSAMPSATEIQAESDLRESNLHASMVFYFQKMFLSYFLREYEQMKVFAEKYFECELNTSWTIIYIHTVHSFYGGLASFWIYRHQKTHNPIWASRGTKAKLAMRSWAESSQHNFQHRAHLLEAEEAFSYDDVEKAKSFYEKAVSGAREHRFINDEALGCELAGHFYLANDMKEKAVGYFLRSHEKYHEWGAVAKSNALFQYVQEVFGQSASSSESACEALSSSFIMDGDRNADDGFGKNRRKRGSG